MIAWLHAPALWGLAAVAGAVLVHLLFRQRAKRIAFPSLRFVTPSFSSAMRIRRPTDAALLALRITIVAAAAAALAQPLLLTPSRTHAWNARIARAIVVDTSASMSAFTPQADEAARAEAAGAASSRRIDAGNLGSGIREASEWLSTAPPARREIVVISDLQQGALSESAIEEATDAAGLRFVRVGSFPSSRDVDGPATLDGDGVATSRVRVDGGATSVVRTRARRPAAGIQIIGPERAEDDVAALLNVVTAAGAPAPSADEPIVVLLGRATLPAPLQPAARAWMLRVVRGLRADDEVTALGETPADGLRGVWMTVLQDAKGAPLIRAAASGDRLVIDVAARPADYLAAVAVRGVLRARGESAALSEQEVLTIPDQALARWARVPPPLETTDAVLRQAAPDARWLWGLVLVLLAAEAVVRRDRVRAEEARADAA